MADKLTPFKGGKPMGPRKGKIVIEIPDADNDEIPISLSTEEGDPLTKAEIVFHLMTAVNMLTLALPTAYEE